MKRMIRNRLGAFVLTLLLAAGAVGGAQAGVMEAEPFLSAWAGEENAVRFTLSMELREYLPFTQRKIDMMNSLLNHVSVWTVLEEEHDDSVTALALAFDGESLGTLTQRETRGTTALETTLLKNRILQNRTGDAMELLFPSEEAPQAESFVLAAALEEGKTAYPALVAACEPYFARKKANYKVKDIGTAKWGQTAKLTQEQSDEIQPLIQAVLQCGMDEAYRAELEQVRFGKNFTIALYQLAEGGADMALYMKGDVIFPDDSTAKLSYQWAFTDQDGQRKDTFQYELTRKGSPSRTVAARLFYKDTSGTMSLEGSSALTLKSSGSTKTQTLKTDLSGTLTDGSRSLTGSVTDTVKITENQKTTTSETSYQPELTFQRSGDFSGLSGTVLVEERRNKDTLWALELRFDPEVPASFLAGIGGLYAVEEENSGGAAARSSVPQDGYRAGSGPMGIRSYTVPGNLQTLYLDALKQEELEAVRDEMFQNFAGRLLLAAMKLPETEIALIRDAMTDEDFSRFLELLDTL